MPPCNSDQTAITTKEVRLTASFNPTADSGTEANAQFKPLVGALVPISNLFAESGGITVIKEINILEKPNATLKRNALLLLFYDNSTTPTSPAIDTAYSASDTGLVYVHKVKSGSATAAAPYDGYRDISSTKAKAYSQPNARIYNGASGSTGSNLIVLFDAAGTLYATASADEIVIEVVVEHLLTCSA